MLPRHARSLQGEQFPVRAEPPESDQTADQHGERQGTRQQRDDFVERDPPDRCHAEATVDDQVGEAQQVFGEHQGR